MRSNRGFSRHAGRVVQRVCDHGEASRISEAVRRAAFSSEWNTSAALFNVLLPLPAKDTARMILENQQAAKGIR
jgi:hypothetical protein